MRPTHATEIDTITIQIDCNNDVMQREILNKLLDYTSKFFGDYIDAVHYQAGFDTRIEYKVYSNNRTIVSFRTGYSHNIYFITIRWAGIRSYDYEADMKSYYYLLVIVAHLNTMLINWKLSELDIAIDVRNVTHENLLAVCTTRTSGTDYHQLGEEQRYEGETTWVEAFKTKLARYTATKRAYLYNKTLKEAIKHGNYIPFMLERFEIKLQSSYFTRNGLDIEKIASTLNMYHLMYIEDVREKYALIERYNSYSNIANREIERMGFEKHRLYPNVQYIINQLNILRTVNDSNIYDYLMNYPSAAQI